MFTTLLSTILPKHFADACSTSGFFGIPPWYEYLVKAGKMGTDPTTGVCTLLHFNAAGAGGDWTVVIMLIVLGILDIVLRLAGMVAVVFVLVGGVKYITSQGSPDSTKQAQETIINALIGLAIALVATALVSFIGNRLG
jgi:hypothetical protein